MNPRTWSKEKKIAAIIFVLIGAIIAVPIGYAIVGGGTSFRYWVWPRWMDNPTRIVRWGFTPWVAIGATISGAFVYAVVLFRHND